MSAQTAITPAGVEVLVLAGGLGTRLRSVVPEAPKVLAPIQGRPFLDHLLAWLARFGFRRAVLSLGYRAAMVEAHLAGVTAPLEVATVTEPAPLGTGGAIAFSRSALTSDPVLVLNGDSWVDVDLPAFLAAHAASGADLSLVAVPVENCSRFGEVQVDESGRVTGFLEKSPDMARPGLINAGVYLLSAALLDRMAGEKPTSFERDVLTPMAGHGLFAHAVPPTRFVDIGTPESFSDINSKDWFLEKGGAVNP